MQASKVWRLQTVLIFRLLLQRKERESGNSRLSRVSWYPFLNQSSSYFICFASWSSVDLFEQMIPQLTNLEKKKHCYMSLICPNPPKTSYLRIKSGLWGFNLPFLPPHPLCYLLPPSPSLTASSVLLLDLGYRPSLLQWLPSLPSGYRISETLPSSAPAPFRATGHSLCPSSALPVRSTYQYF